MLQATCAKMLTGSAGRVRKRNMSPLVSPLYAKWFWTKEHLILRAHISEKHLIHIWNEGNWTGTQYFQNIFNEENSSVPIVDFGVWSEKNSINLPRGLRLPISEWVKVINYLPSSLQCYKQKTHQTLLSEQSFAHSFTQAVCVCRAVRKFWQVYHTYLSMKCHSNDLGKRLTKTA